MEYTIEEENENDLRINKVGMNCDEDLIDNLHPTLINRNHIANFCGKSGSGKTNLLVNLLNKNKKNGIRQSYKRVFHDIIIVSPSLSSFDDSIFDDISPEKKFVELNSDTLEFIDEFTQANTEENKNTLIIFDDVGSSLKNGENERLLGLLTQKYRHIRTSFWFLTQKFRDLPTKLRANLSAIYLFRPVSLKELDTIHSELLSFDKKFLKSFIEFVYKRKYDFLYIDLSLIKSPTLIFHKNFKKILFKNKNEKESFI
tara:strand:- start:401 stop:1171 length:771 start_codon:yes stop_codon:yes gene_type:complete